MRDSKNKLGAKNSDLNKVYNIKNEKLIITNLPKKDKEGAIKVDLFKAQNKSQSVTGRNGSRSDDENSVKTEEEKREHLID